MVNEIFQIIINGIVALAWVGAFVSLVFTILLGFTVYKFFKAPPQQRTWIIAFGILLTVLFIAVILPDPATPYGEIILGALTMLVGKKMVEK